MRAAFVSVVAVLVGLCGLIGFAHTSAGRPLRPLAQWIERHAARSCPFGYDRAPTGAERDAARASFAAAHRGAQPASQRPALGFSLDHTTRADVDTWASQHGVHCKAARGMADVACEDLPDGVLPGAVRAQALWLTFGADGTLKSVVALRRAPAPSTIRGEFEARVQTAKSACAAEALSGDPATLDAGVLRQASAEFRCSDYYALTRATNMGDGFLLTEEYRAL